MTLCVGFKTLVDFSGDVEVGFFTLVDPGDDVEVGFKTHVSFVEQVEVGFRTSVAFLSQTLAETMAPAIPTTPEEEEELRLAISNVEHGIRLLLHNVIDDTVDDLTEYVKTWSVKESRNAKGTATIVLRNTDRELRPFLSEGDTFYQKFDGDYIDQDRQLRRYMTLESFYNGVPFEYPWMVQLSYGYRLDPDMDEVTLEMVDLTELLLGEDEAMEDFVSTDDALVTAHQACAAILTKYGVPSYRLEFDDYFIQQFSPKGGTPLSWIEKIIWVRQAEWLWEKDTFVIRQPSYRKAGPPEWRFIDRFDIKFAGIKRSTQELRNEFLVRKTEKASTPLHEEECRGRQCLGFQERTFEPANIVSAQFLKILKGSIHSVNFKGVNGEVISVSNPTGGSASSSTPIGYISFIYEPSPFEIFAENELPAFDLIIDGKRPINNPEYPQFEPSFSKLVVNETNQARFGIRRGRTPIENSLIPDGATALRTGQLLIEENVRMMRPTNWTALLRPSVRCGQTIEIELGWAGYRNPSLFGYTEGITKRGTQTEAVMDLELSGYDPDAA